MKKLTTLGLLLFSMSMLIAQESSIQMDVMVLAHDSLGGREMGTEGEEKAAEIIAMRMDQIQLEAKGTGSEGREAYKQVFSVTPKANPHATTADTTQEPIVGRNVMGYLNNEAEYTIVIGAHFDHLGTGKEGSLHAAKDGQIHNGADDNASGVALTLRLAELIKGNEALSGNNYLFMAFSGEEKGLWGSNYYCKNPTIDLEKVNFMINFDMVGRLDTSRGLAINGVGTSPVWKEQIEKSNKENFKLVLGESGVGPSDHTSFYLQDIPVLHFFTGQHEDYHKPSDDVEKINFEGIESIAQMIVELLKGVNDQGKLAFTKTKEEKSNTPRFTVTLGVMPDYLYQGEGMRIDGVTEGRPAAKAGFEKGDIVIQMGDVEVDGMMSYMKALSRFKKGDKTTVKVKRGEKVVKKKVEF